MAYCPRDQINKMEVNLIHDNEEFKVPTSLLEDVSIYFILK